MIGKQGAIFGGRTWVCSTAIVSRLATAVVSIATAAPKICGCQRMKSRSANRHENASEKLKRHDPPSAIAFPGLFIVKYKPEAQVSE